MSHPNNETLNRSIVEEVFNSITHGLGAIGGIVGLVIGLLTLAAPTTFRFGFIIYALSLILLMTISALYHALTFTRAKRLFEILDFSGIFLLIAGSFTPFILRFYDGRAQFIMLGVVWLLAAAGIVIATSLPKILSKFGPLLYIGFGWLGLVFIPKLHQMPTLVIWLLVIGGLLYTLGVLLLISNRPFMHVGWHMFVVGAAVAHYFAIFKLA